MENLENMDWEEITPPENSEQEMKEIQKSLQKRNWKLVLTSLVLVTALFLCIVYVAMPLAEKLYWSPMDATLDQYSTDLNLVLQAYTELFLPGKTVSVLWGDVGFTDYELHMTLHDTVRDTDQHFMGRMYKGRLSFDMEFFDDQTMGLFRSAVFPEFPVEALEKDIAIVREKLQALPAYIRLEAAVTFPEDLSMAELLTRMEYDYIGKHGDLEVIWAAIRTQDPDAETGHQTVGISFTLSPLNGGVNDVYPEFMLSCYEPTGSTLESHFKSVLKFSSDQMLQGHGVLSWHEDHNFYEQALHYVEENGVSTYGCIITGTPETLLALLDSGDILDMKLMDAWIDVG